MAKRKGKDTSKPKGKRDRAVAADLTHDVEPFCKPEVEAEDEPVVESDENDEGLPEVGDTGGDDFGFEDDSDSDSEVD